MTVDLALVGGRVAATASAGGEADSIAIAGGRILAVGSEELVRSLGDRRTRVTALDGATVRAGFIDTHMHLEKIAREMAMLHLDGVVSLEALLTAVRTRAADSAPGSWIRSFGDDGAWHERQLRERRLPTRRELDVAAPNHRVVLYRGPDAAVLNSAAIDSLAEAPGRIPEESFDPERGLVVGAPARELDRRLPVGDIGERLAQLAQASSNLCAMGITSVVDPGLPGAFAASWSLYAQASASGMLRQRLTLMNRLDPSRSFAEELRRVTDGPVHPGDGDDRIRAGAIKILLDGEFSNAWLRPGESSSSGTALIRYRSDEIAIAVELCVERGWPLCIHAMGGGAIDCVIDAVDASVAHGRAVAPAQISIAHAFLATPANITACERLGIALSVQPMLAYAFEEAMCEAWGDLADQANRYATMVRSGLVVAGGSDTLPCEPLRGARYAVDRTARHGTVLGVGEAIDPGDALSLFAERAGAYLQRADLGRIAPGCHADLVVWEEDPLACGAGRWPEVPVRLVIVGGEQVWP